MTAGGLAASLAAHRKEMSGAEIEAAARIEQKKRPHTSSQDLMAAAQPSPPMLAGKCLCGAVAFEAARDRNDAEACHCGQCRRWSGSGWMNVNVRYDTLKFTGGADKVGWYRSSSVVRRGFCKECGSALFWHADRHPDHAHTIAISAGSLEAPTGLKLAKHIFVSDKGDYYDIADGLPQKEKY